MDIIKLGTIAAIMVAIVNCQDVQIGDMCKDDQIKYMCHPTNPAKFTRCVANILNVFDCPTGLLFNVVVQTCDWPANSGCGGINAIAAGGAPPEDKPSAPVKEKEPPNAPGRMEPSAPGRKEPNAPGRMEPSAPGGIPPRPPVRMQDPQGPFENPFLTDAPPPSFRFNTQDNSVKDRPTSSPTKKRRMRKRKGRRRKKIRRTSKRPLFTRARTPIATSPAPKPPQRPKPQKPTAPKRDGPCDPLSCKLPRCRCPGTDIPGNLPVDEVPMMVTLTFDDAVNTVNENYFNTLFSDKRKNPNGCPIRGTFFVSGDGTSFKIAKKLYDSGHEIASHSISHRFPTTWWKDAGYNGFEQEIEGMRKKLSTEAKIPYHDIKGMRVPFLQVGGNGQYEVLRDYKYLFDSSMVTGHLFRSDQPPIWPFTLDYPPGELHCKIGPCPTTSFPGIWEFPLQRWYDLEGRGCAMPDACTVAGNKRNTIRFLRENFNHYYKTNRAPLGIFIHATWFQRTNYHFDALNSFIGELSRMKDVWIIPITQSLEWVSKPTPISELKRLQTWSC